MRHAGSFARFYRGFRGGVLVWGRRCDDVRVFTSTSGGLFLQELLRKKRGILYNSRIYFLV